MPGTHHLYERLYKLVATVVVANCVPLCTASGQGGSVEPAAACAAYTSVPLPAEAKRAPVPKESPACASYRSYRGIGRAVNFSEARACAWKERLAQEADLAQNPKEGMAWVVGGSLILADIYFNGAGIKRNVPLAMRFACESEQGMAELAMPEIAKLNGAPPADKPFEFCDYAVTTFTMNFCSEYEAEIRDDRRSRYYDSLKSSMSAKQRAAFEKLLAAKNAYIVAHASEVYQGGTVRNIRTIGSQEILEELFHTELVHFERKRWPALSSVQTAEADGLLDREYKKQIERSRKQTEDEIEDGAVTADGLTKAERGWSAYRDAWVAFARLRYPTAVPAIRAEITLDRYRYVKTIQE